MRFILNNLCIGFNATSICMVEQFGLAIILSSGVKILPFISGIISFTFGSILQAEELSITIVPTFLNFGAHSFDIDAPAEKRAI